MLEKDQIEVLTKTLSLITPIKNIIQHEDHLNQGLFEAMPVANILKS